MKTITDPKPAVQAMAKAEVIPLAKPLLGEQEAAAARRAILSGWVTQGPETEAFEREWAEHVGALNGIAVSSCTTAMHLVLHALGVGPGDEVITVSHSFIATVNAIRYTGATPVMVDIEPATFNISPQCVEAAITPQTKAILCVHQMGMPCNLLALSLIAERHGLALIEDCACAMGSEIKWGRDWTRIGGSITRAACFSLHPRKVITTGDGGMITTDDADLAAKLRLLRQHGMSVSDRARHGSNQVVFEDYPVMGFNYRMTDVQSAMGREQLKRLDGIVKRRRELAAAYRERLAGVVETPLEPEGMRSNWQSYCVRLPQGVEQAGVMQMMLDEGISTRRGIMCSHREAACADLPKRFELPHSEQAQDRCIVLPLFPQMTDTELERVCDALQRAVENPISFLKP